MLMGQAGQAMGLVWSQDALGVIAAEGGGAYRSCHGCQGFHPSPTADRTVFPVVVFPGTLSVLIFPFHRENPRKFLFHDVKHGQMRYHSKIQKDS